MDKVIYESDISTVIHALIGWLTAAIFMNFIELHNWIDVVTYFLIGNLIGIIPNGVQELYFQLKSNHPINLIDVFAGWLPHLVVREGLKLKGIKKA